MNKYKVEFEIVSTYVIDVKAANQEKAILKAQRKLYKIIEGGLLHYHQIGDESIEIGNVYDVTDTEDPFND